MLLTDIISTSHAVHQSIKVFLNCSLFISFSLPLFPTHAILAIFGFLLTHPFAGFSPLPIYPYILSNPGCDFHHPVFSGILAPCDIAFDTEIFSTKVFCLMPCCCYIYSKKHPRTSFSFFSGCLSLFLDTWGFHTF